MEKKNPIHTRIAALALTAVIVIAGLGACKPIREFVDVVDIIKQDLPSTDDTFTSLLEINRAMSEAMARGETELTFNATGVDEEELKNIGVNLSTFWGKPVRYSINNEFKDLEGIVPDKAVDVKNITNSFELSNNFYVYDFLVNDMPIPEDKPYATRIADALPAIAEEIFADPGASDYEKALAAHDWLVSRIDYDETTPEHGDENGSYGAIVLKRTMCLGYAEGFELLLRCYTDLEVLQIVGYALNFNNDRIFHDTDAEAADAGAEAADAADENESAEGEDAEAAMAEEDDPEAAWGGHAWNAVKIDGSWYQVDATFNDPMGNPTNNLSHFYFGQTDEVMSRNHQWEPEYFPVSDKENFLYFRKSGLFAEDWESFQAILTDLLAEEPVSRLEIAVEGESIDENNIQFLYKIRNDLDEIWWNEQVWEDIRVNSLELIYSTFSPE